MILTPKGQLDVGSKDQPNRAWGMRDSCNYRMGKWSTTPRGRASWSFGRTIRFSGSSRAGVGGPKLSSAGSL